MEDQDSPWLSIDVDSLHRVTDPDQAAVIADPHRQQFLQPFLGVECTVARAAAQLGCTPNAMLYRVRRMVDAGILQVVRTEPRAGRAVKVYRSVHDGYFIPTEVMHYHDVRHRVAAHSRVLVGHLIDAYVGVLADAEHSGRAIARNAGGGIWASDLMPLRNRRGQPAYFGDTTVRLTKAPAEEIQALLHRALDRAVEFSRAHSRGGESAANPEPYLFVGAILPT